MYSALRLRALAKLAEDLQPIHKQVTTLAFDMQVREKELRSLNVPNKVQKDLADDLLDLSIQIEELLLTLDVFII